MAASPTATQFPIQGERWAPGAKLADHRIAADRQAADDAGEFDDLAVAVSGAAVEQRGPPSGPVAGRGRPTRHETRKSG